MLIRLLCIFLLLLVTQQSFANSPWPKENWPRKTLKDAGINPRRFDRFLDAAFANNLTIKTDSIVVVKDGHLIFESHLNGYHRGQRHALFSLGKTFINALIGIMEKQNLLHRSDQLSRHYPAVNAQGTKRITIEQLLHMSSGLQWIEEDRENLLHSDPFFAFYSRSANKDMPAWVAKRSQDFPADSKFNYSSGDSALLVAAIRGALGEQRYPDYAWEQLFKPLGLRSVAIERDQAGHLGLHGIAYASPLDVARLGLLYLRHGKVDGQQLWPADWVHFTSTMAPAQLTPADPNDRNLQNNQAYGAHIWLNVKRAGDNSRPYPELPANALFGLGSRGQILLILPDENLIFVRMATDTEISVTARKSYRQKLFRLLYSSLGVSP